MARVDSSADGSPLQPARTATTRIPGRPATPVAVPTDRVVDALARLYLPFGRDGPQRFPSLWSGVSFADMLSGDLAEVCRHVCVPGDLVFVNRTLAGMYMILSRLGPTAEWGRIAREYLFGASPSTQLGIAERAWAELRDRRA